jgi:hypothetical protein
LLLGTRASVITTSASTTVTIASPSTTESTLASATGGTIATITTASTTTSESTSAASAALLGSFNEALIEFNGLLSFAFSLTLGLSSGSGDKVFYLVFRELLGIRPFLVLLRTLVWLTGLGDTSTKSKLLFSQLGKVVGVRDIVVFWFGRLNDAFSVTS